MNSVDIELLCFIVAHIAFALGCVIGYCNGRLSELDKNKNKDKE